ncbi:MAG: sigma-E factor negative regulatory protein [Salinisphaera sp.]|nr:sigma-E factor negative regulatory protein [Salinisphaera sp.]
MLDERLSAFVDDETADSETRTVLAALTDDPVLREAWQRQLWLRAALRGRDLQVPALDAGFADRVMAALEDTPAEPGKVVALAARRRPRLMRRAAAGLALAASLAAVAVLVSTPVGQLNPFTVPEGAVLASAAAPDQIQPADLVATTISQPQPKTNQWSVSDPAVADLLNVYLIEHSDVARGYGMSAATPSFVHLVTYGQDAGR